MFHFYQKNQFLLLLSFFLPMFLNVSFLSKKSISICLFVCIFLSSENCFWYSFGWTICCGCGFCQNWPCGSRVQTSSRMASLYDSYAPHATIKFNIGMAILFLFLFLVLFSKSLNSLNNNLDFLRDVCMMPFGNFCLPPNIRNRKLTCDWERLWLAQDYH